MANNEIIEIAAELIHETDMAFLISDDGANEIWVPKSQVVDNEDGTFSMPEWLALDKGFI